eukprot:m.335734 g.335734  ORF g.335734 m.335734 type:complete len:600 (+) comp17665_c0_seq1:229-2028(+)
MSELPDELEMAKANDEDEDDLESTPLLEGSFNRSFNLSKSNFKFKHNRTHSEPITFGDLKKPSPEPKDPEPTTPGLFANIGGTPLMRRKKSSLSQQSSPFPSRRATPVGQERALISQTFGVPTVVYFYMFTLGACWLSVGYDLGAMSLAKLGIAEEFNLTSFQVDSLLGVFAMMAAVGGLVAGWLAESVLLGRRWTLTYCALCQLLGTGLVVAANGYSMLFVGRVFLGIGMGGSMMCSPVLAAELSPANIRGALISMLEIANNLGIVIGFIVGFVLKKETDGWRWILGAAMSFPIILIWCIRSLPESPRWLVERGEIIKAEQVLREFCEHEEQNQTIALLQNRVLGTNSSWADVLCPPQKWSRRIWAGMGTAVIQQITGIETVLYFTPELLEKSSIKTLNERLFGSMAIGFIRLLFVVFALFVVDKRWGRKPMLIVSAVIIAIAHIVSGIFFSLDNPDDPAPPYILVIGLSLFMSGYSMGYGPVCWVLVSEVFPLEIRGLSAGVATFYNRLTSGLILLLFRGFIIPYLTSAGIFYLWAGLSALSIIFTCFVISETKGRSLEEIESEMLKPWLPSRARSGYESIETGNEQVSVSTGEAAQ